MKKALSVRKALHGITFKEEYANKLTLTDRTSPPSDTDVLEDPIEELIGNLKNNDSASLNDEEQNDRLNRALGL